MWVFIVSFGSIPVDIYYSNVHGGNPQIYQIRMYVATFWSLEHLVAQALQLVQGLKSAYTSNSKKKILLMI